MEATLLLADSALQSPDGKVHALGLGWSVTKAPTPPAAILLLIKVPWDQANRKQKFVLQLLDTDSQQVMLPGPMGDQPVRVEGEFESGRPAGLPSGVPLDVQLVIPVAAGLPLTPGVYVWQLEVQGDPEPSTTSFVVQAP